MISRRMHGVAHDERVVHADGVDGAQPFVHTGQRLRVRRACGRFLTVMFGGVSVHQRGTRVEQHHHGERLLLFGEFGHTADDRLMS